MMASLAAGGGVSVPSSDGTMEEGTPAPSPEGKQGSNLERKETEQGMYVPGWECEAANAAMSTARDGGKTDTLQEQMDYPQNEKCTNVSSRTLPSQAENFPTDISLKLTMVRRKSGCPDPRLQRQLREQLRLLENDSREVMAVFSELSARLLSIHSDQDLIVVTFKTFEEIWKFLTYHSLGFINHCMENLFLDQSFWLCSQEDEETGIEVCVNEKSLKLMYRSLLVQEGAFFVLHPDNLVTKITATDCETNTYFETAAFTEDVTDGSVDGDMTVLSNVSLEPLIPFHQWFLKVYSDPIDVTYKTECKSIRQVATGSCLAVMNYESTVPEEIGFQEGDKIEILGYLVECMEWFVGRHLLTGQIGFVKTNYVKLDLPGNKAQDLDFLKAEELSCFSKEKQLEEVIHLLKQTSITDVCSVYRIDQLEEQEFQKTHECEIPCSHSNMVSTSKNGRIEEFLKNFKNLEVTRAGGPATEGKDSAKSPNQEILPPPAGPCFYIYQDDGQASDVFESLLLFLNREEYERDFKNLYDFSYPFINSMFYGFSEEDELVSFFSIARELAKKAGMSWALARLCFLLGRLSFKKVKFSQARVYFEEALGAVSGGFSDLYFVIALYTNLAAIYLTQKNKEKCAHIFDKATSLLMGIPNYICSADLESDILKYALKRTILSQNKHAEARACFLLVKHYTARKQHEEALPFLERLQLLLNNLGLQNNLSKNCYFKLAESYNEKCLPHIVLSCIKVSSSQSSSTLMDSLKRIDLVIKNAPKLYGLRKLKQILPSQIAPYLIQALSSAFTSEQQGLCSTIYLSLAKLYSHHKRYGKAIVYMMKALDSDTSAKPEETINYLVSLAWLYILYRQYDVAVTILNAVVDSSWSNPRQLGVAYNMLAIALKRTNNTKEAAESCYKALRLSEEANMTHNQAIALANFGALCLHAEANKLAEHYYIKAVKLFSKLSSMDCGQEFIQVLLQLGCYYISGTQREKGRFYYEWAFLVAMETSHLESQLQAIKLLCQFYSTVVPNEAQCVIYNEYQLSLARKMSNKVLEGQILETISQLYLSLGTERAYRSALEYTKRSLGIFIDLQKKEKEAYAWLRAGKIYYVLRQNELVDLYIQVAQDAALHTGDPNLAMELFEAAGDIFFNGSWEKEKAVTFYKDRALPLAVEIGNKNTELRLYNKLVELLVNLKVYEESLEYAKASLMLSVNLGNQLNERIAYHRLAAIHHHLGHCELAEHFYLKALSLCSSPLEFEEETLYYVKVYLNLGDIIFYDLKDPFDAAGYYHLALAAAMDLGNKKAQLKIYTRLAIIYHNFLVDREMSLFFYQKARMFATELNVRRINLAPDQCYKNL
ncbi:SH3 domain and tetratricopeptide repeat-containing protein 1 isoform X1 [Anser cygnoides]|uniref:SH3 domain and tetratricopeptide repeats 1 n=2 Tax=Anser cygnoides TaxID=8845 RepID=A0A8B9DFL2_ANSCY|nr:SH3 domain and tetratricopeptide repeat-containing protein 1 isoform X1 [Anser cygnoides]XP_013034685.1 SH3 domain and tetratricopeptide repeat-containing protein 1 isoform X1 [Anser cygnoides]XP_013034691.1 SH3 domain and tetratricopeptide repeat-containing protein 1 isoform X1 [Anser cygnoides]XP_013034696.1 SH3 domain and tetratricopeptide repeat-containing protein 1 isoform X1 [Anser cygnoides]